MTTVIVKTPSPYKTHSNHLSTTNVIQLCTKRLNGYQIITHIFFTHLNRSIQYVIIILIKHSE